MKPNSQHRAEPNATFVALSAQAHELADELAHEPAHELAHELAHEHAHVGAATASNGLHRHAADALAGDVGALDVGHGAGHQALNERGLTACRDVFNLLIEPHARADLIIPDLPPFVERASNALSPVALAPGRSGEPHLSVIQLPP